VDPLATLNNYMIEAETILKSDTEFKLSGVYELRKQKIIALCLKYNFKFKFLNNIVLINSILNEWHFNFCDRNITLYHRNKLKDLDNFHNQGDFKSVVNAVRYINKHDNFFYKPNKHHGYNKIDNILNKKRK
jgi:hypothetical protein